MIIIAACNSTDETTSDKNQYNLEEQFNDSIKKQEDIDTDIDTPNIIEQNQNLNTNSVKSISELWDTYKTCKADAIEDYGKGDLSSMIKNFESSANAAIDLSRNKLASAQFNNIGHYSIEEFSKKTDYNNRVRNLAVIGDQAKKEIYFKETQQIFKQNYQLLINSEPYLIKARKLDGKYKSSKLGVEIQKNLSFIKWVKNFLRNGLTQ